MARRKSLTLTTIQIRKDLERQKLERDRQKVAAVKAREKAAKAAERAAKAKGKERLRLHVEARSNEAAAAQADLVANLEELGGLLTVSLETDSFINLDEMKESFEAIPFNPGKLAEPAPRPDLNSYLPHDLVGLGKFFPWAKTKHAESMAEANKRHGADTAWWEASEEKRLRRLEKQEVAYANQTEIERQRIAGQNAEVDALLASVLAAESGAVVEYFEMILTSSIWPDGFPSTFVLAYDPSSHLLGVDYTLPAMDIVPTVKTYRYVKTRDEITTTAEGVTRRSALYKSIVAQSAIRILHEIIGSDRFGIAETVALNCYVDTVDPSTGQPVQPCILSVRTTRETFTKINLNQVQPEACLKGLAAAVSPNPSELAPVRPVVELKTIDSRFVQEQDVLSDLDQRPNLLDLDPYEFESLITNLFSAMGYVTKQTPGARDGGVDCIAYNSDPIFGGKAVIQAKRYKDTVGVAAVRELYGVVQNEGASKGILVTTSGYGQASYDFAKGKPIELFTGGHLLYLLDKHTGVDARIAIPTKVRGSEIDLREVAKSEPPAPSRPGTNPQQAPYPQPRSEKP